MIRKTITDIINYFTNKPQEPEVIFKPLVKLEQEKPKQEKQDEIAKYFKTEQIRKRCQYLHPQVHQIMLEMIAYCVSELKIHPIVTETYTTLDEDQAVKRVSITHREGRAFDIRTRGWNDQQINKFRDYFNDKYLSLGAIGISTGKPILIVHHDTGSGPHFHIQFNKNFTVIQKGEIA